MTTFSGRAWGRTGGLLLLAAALTSCGKIAHQTAEKPEPAANPHDWPQWGGAVERAMVSGETGLPSTLEPAVRVAGKDAWDTSRMKNVKWVAPLGKSTYGNPTVANGRVFVGTTCSDADPRYQGDRGSVMCFDEATGRLLWQLNVPRDRGNKTLAAGLGITSAPTVDGNRIYTYGYGGDVLCLDVLGMRDGNDGPFFDEEAYYGVPGPWYRPFRVRAGDGDILWRYSVIEHFGIQSHNALAFSPLAFGKYVYASSGNGVNMGHKVSDTPQAPTLLVFDKRTGELVAQDDEQIGTRVFHGEWNSPAIGRVNGKPLLLYGAGDGVCYAFEPEPVPVEGRKVGTLRKVWSFDMNDGRHELAYRAKLGPSEILATPVCVSNRVYVTVGQDWTHGKGAGRLACIDATRTGDITQSGRLWVCDDIGRSLATVAVADGLAYATDTDGNILCLDAVTGQKYWAQNVGHPLWDSTLVADGRVYVGDSSGRFYILAAGKELKPLFKTDFDEHMCGAPVAANGVLYVATFGHLYAFAEPKK